VVCQTRLFSFDQKFQTKTGYATFFTSVPERVKIIEGEEVEFDDVNFQRLDLNLKTDRYQRC